MRTIQELVSQPPIFLGRFSKPKDVINQFFGISYSDEAEKEEIYKQFVNINILFAHYEGCSYDGYAFVLFEKEGKLYEVNGSHCSCYGLEDQWIPEETFLEALKFRIKEGKLGNNGYCSDTNFKGELETFLSI